MNIDDPILLTKLTEIDSESSVNTQAFVSNRLHNKAKASRKSFKDIPVEFLRGLF